VHVCVWGVGRVQEDRHLGVVCQDVVCFQPMMAEPCCLCVYRGEEWGWRTCEKERGGE